jgi:MFS transporter, DHA1 family, tetracycline resistance protein
MRRRWCWCLILGSAYQEYAAALIAGIRANIAFPSIVTMLSDRVAPERAAGLEPRMVGSAAAMGLGISSVILGALGGLGHALPGMLAAALKAGAPLAMTMAGAGWQRTEAPGWASIHLAIGKS